MDRAAQGKRVRIYFGERDHAEGHHTPLWEDILTLLRDEGADGVTVFQGLAGFGAHGRIHTSGLADFAPDRTVLLEWIDGLEHVERLLPRVADLVGAGMITTEDVDIVAYTHRAPRSLPGDTVGDVMTRAVAVLHPNTPLGEAIRMLLDRNYRALPVVDDSNRVVGIVTNGDLIRKGGLKARLELLGALTTPAVERELTRSGVRDKTASDVMTNQVVLVSAGDSLKRAAELMLKHHVKRLPVVDGSGYLAGMVSRIDLLRTMGEDYSSPMESATPATPTQAHTVAGLMRKDAPAIHANAGLGEILDAVTSTRLNRAVVIDDERRVLGIVSDAALLQQLDPAAESGLLDALMGRYGPINSARVTARDPVQMPPTVVTIDTTVDRAAELMLDQQEKLLVVVDAEGCLAGVLDRADLLRHLLATKPPT